MSYSAPFILVGKDVTVDLTDIRHSMVDQILDEQEGNVILASATNPLNLEPVVPAGKQRTVTEREVFGPMCIKNSITDFTRKTHRFFDPFPTVIRLDDNIVKL